MSHDQGVTVMVNRVDPDRSIVKLPDELLVAICTPSTVIGRLGDGSPSIRTLSPLTSVRGTVIAAWAHVRLLPARPTTAGGPA